MVAAKDLMVTLTVGDLEELVTNDVNDALSGLNDFSEKKSPTVFKKYLNKHDTCEYLNISMSTLNKWIRQEDFPFIRVEGVYRFKIDEIEQWIEGKKEKKRV